MGLIFILIKFCYIFPNIPTFIWEIRISQNSYFENKNFQVCSEIKEIWKHLYTCQLGSIINILL